MLLFRRTRTRNRRQGSQRMPLPGHKCMHARKYMDEQMTRKHNAFSRIHRIGESIKLSGPVQRKNLSPVLTNSQSVPKSWSDSKRKASLSKYWLFNASSHQVTYTDWLRETNSATHWPQDLVPWWACRPSTRAESPPSNRAWTSCPSLSRPAAAQVHDRTVAIK